MGTNRISAIAPFNILYKRVIVLAKALENIPNEFRITKGLTNGRQYISQLFSLIVVGRHRFVQFLEITKFIANSHGPRHGLRRKTGIKGTPGLVRGCSKEDHARHSRHKRGLDSAENSLILRRPLPMSRVW
jgi:hypothetical protein